jgi:hypothetical protein
MLVLGLVRKFHLNEAKEGEIVPLGLEWNHSPAAGERSPTGYVGLKNLGCTCYMNSLLQQFFMMPDFRKGILSIDFPTGAPPHSYACVCAVSCAVCVFVFGGRGSRSWRFRR